MAGVCAHFRLFLPALRDCLSFPFFKCSPSFCCAHFNLRSKTGRLSETPGLLFLWWLSADIGHIHNAPVSNRLRINVRPRYTAVCLGSDLLTLPGHHEQDYQEWKKWGHTFLRLKITGRICSPGFFILSITGPRTIPGAANCLFF